MEKRKLTKKEKKEFLDNDFTDRIIRIEQKVSAKFGKLIDYDQTECYKSLTKENKKQYNKFLKDKKQNKVKFMTTFLVVIMGSFLVNFQITGNVVKENIGKTGHSLLSIVSISLLLLLALFSTIMMINKKRKQKKYNTLFKPLEKLVNKK